MDELREMLVLLDVGDVSYALLSAAHHSTLLCPILLSLLVVTCCMICVAI